MSKEPCSAIRTFSIRLPRTPIALAAIGLLALVASADSGTDSSESFFESIARRLNQLGERAEDLIAPRVGPLWNLSEGDFRGAASQTREFVENYPVRADGVVSVINEFGEIRIKTWDNSVVRVQADILAKADTADLAMQIVLDTRIRVNALEDLVEVRTGYPDTRDIGSVQVNYVVTVPRSVNVLCDNNFGDTVVSGVGGTLGLNARFGHVDLRDIGGRVSAHMSGGGEFSLQAHNLREGGVFDLEGAKAEFGNVSKLLKISSHMGSITLRDLAPEVQVDVISESGPIEFHVPENATPDITASVLDGAVRSDIEMDETSHGSLLVARSPNVESKRRASLHASFNDVYIYREGLERPPSVSGQEGADLIDGGVLSHDVDVPEGVELAVEAVRGDIRIEGVDEGHAEIRATRTVRLLSGKDAAAARAALEALTLDVETLDTRILVRTSVRDDLAALGCTYYRVDLLVRCPRTTPLKVHGANGHTSIEGMGAPVSVEQSEGSIVIEHNEGALDLTNRKGNVNVSNCAGPVAVSATQGAVTTRSVHSKQTISCIDGKTVIDAPRGEVVVRNRGGDARIMALEGILGAYDVRVEQGDLSIAVPDTADASFLVTATNGQIHASSMVLTGTIEREVRKFQGRLNGGAHSVSLEAEDGDIVID